MSMKIEASDAVVDSNEKNEGYLKIYYPKSTKFIKAPLDKNGKLLFLDIKKLDPSIVCLNLINSERTKFYDAVNGCFEEPPEKWSSFKVGAVLKISTNNSNSLASINASIVKSDPDGQQVIPHDTIPRAVKQEPCFESGVAGNIPPSSLTTAARQVKQEASDLPMESCANQYQSPSVASSCAENVVVKQEMLSNSQSSDEPLPSSAVQSNGKKSYDFFTANFVSNNKFRPFNNMKNNLIHRITVAQLILPFEDPLLFEKFFFLSQNIKRHPCLKDFFPESCYCKNCQKDLREVNSILLHTFTGQHMRTALTQDELDKLIEAVSVIDYSDDGPFFTTTKVKVKKVKPPKAKVPSAEDVDRPRLPDTLNVSPNGEYEYFTNQFYPKKDFDSLKRHLIHRIIEANLTLPFNDPLFVEKVLFLRSKELYLKIYYPNSSDCIEVPLDANDGRLLFSDIKALDTNISALNLTKSNVARLCKPKNGCIKEPKEKWNTFKVVAVLQDSTNAFNSSTNNNVISNRKLSTDSEVQLPTVSTSTAAATNKESCSSLAKSGTTEMPSASSLPSQGVVVTQTRLPVNHHFNQSSSSVPSLNAFQSRNETLPSHENVSKEVTDSDVFAAYNVFSFYELRDLLCHNNPKFYGCFTIIFHYLRRTMIAFPDHDFVKLYFYAYRSDVPLKTLNQVAPDFCYLCKHHFTIRHLVSKEHVIKYQSKYKQDPPEIPLILELKNRAHIITCALLMKNDEDPFDYFINKYYPKEKFDTFKNHLVFRIRAASLMIPFTDPLLFEKLFFLSLNVNHHPTLKDVFRGSYFCTSCNKYLPDVNAIVFHTFTEQHMLTCLSQEELNKLIQAVSIVDYSKDGSSSSSLNENGKRNYQENTDITLKRQRRT